MIYSNRYWILLLQLLVCVSLSACSPSKDNRVSTAQTSQSRRGLQCAIIDVDWIDSDNIAVTLELSFVDTPELWKLEQKMSVIATFFDSNNNKITTQAHGILFTSKEFSRKKIPKETSIVVVTVPKEAVLISMTIEGYNVSTNQYHIP